MTFVSHIRTPPRRPRVTSGWKTGQAIGLANIAPGPNESFVETTVTSREGIWSSGTTVPST